jgi:hypothetical protein
MSGAAFLRIKKLKGGGIITAAARHNKREIQAEMGATGSIDPTRSHLSKAMFIYDRAQVNCRDVEPQFQVHFPDTPRRMKDAHLAEI